MPKAKQLDRLELTRKKMQAREKFLTDKKTKAESPFIKMRNELLAENPELDDFHTCPSCGGQLIRWEGCYRCKKCGWSKC